MQTLMRFLFGLVSAISLVGVASAQAPGSRWDNAGARIDRFDVEQVRQMIPGTDLDFRIWGTPGSVVTLQVEGAERRVMLEEVRPGVYEGTHTISLRDRITPDSDVTANLRFRNRVITALLDESLIRERQRNRPRGRDYQSRLPTIERFDVAPNNNLTWGNELPFTLWGTPGGQVSVDISGGGPPFALREVRPGEYVGVYTVDRRDRIEANSRVVATLRVNDRAVNAVLQRPLITAAPVPVRPVWTCDNCGVIEAVNLIEVQGDGNYIGGTIAGGVVGAVLGSQIGGGSGRTAAQIAGTIGGALAGREIQRRTDTGVRPEHFEVVVRMQMGGTRTVTYQSDPGFRVGERVRLTDGTLARY